jgi:hypothetical protein
MFNGKARATRPDFLIGSTETDKGPARDGATETAAATDLLSWLLIEAAPPMRHACVVSCATRKEMPSITSDRCAEIG